MGEFVLIDAIRKHFPDPPAGEIWSGDDAAVFHTGTTNTVFTTDVLVEGVDFDLAYSPPQSVGFKAMAVNASDVAAMGGRPHRAVATLSLPPETMWGVVDAMAQGLAAAGRSLGVDLVGGDISQASEISLNVAMIGSIEKEPVTRSGARVGDVICVTGQLGGAAGGLEILRSGRRIDSQDFRALVFRQMQPSPRLKEGQTIAMRGATSMIDISDGLLADLTHLLDASRVGCRIDLDRVPIDDQLTALSDFFHERGLDISELAITGGEDFELLFTIPPERLEPLEGAFREAGTRLSVIGEVTSDDRLVGDRNLEEWNERGWQHLRNP